MAISNGPQVPGHQCPGIRPSRRPGCGGSAAFGPDARRVIKKLNEVSYERKYRQLMLGNAVRLGEDQLPEVWALQRRCANTFDIAICPRLYVTQAPVGNALTIGSNEPMTLVSSGLAGSFDSDELARGPRARDGPCAGRPCGLHDDRSSS